MEHDAERRRQHGRGVEDAAEESERRDHEGGDEVHLLELLRPEGDDEARGGEAERHDHAREERFQGMRHLGTDEEGGGGPGHSSHDQRAGRTRGEERGEDLQIGERGHQQVHDGALQLHDE